MHIPFILLPVFAYVLLTLIFAKGASGEEVLYALVKGHIVLFAFVAISTEILSLIYWISFPFLLTIWLLFLFICFIVLFSLKRKYVFTLPVLERISPQQIILIGVIAFILTATFASSILYPPNNWDSMTYHMSRVAHWINNNNVSFYPTTITRQNYQMPLAEFAIMHLQILTRSDLYANIVQWISFLVLTCLGFIVAGELGLSKRQRFISAICIATLPMGILQASSTQNDIVVSCFVMSFGLFMLRLRDSLSVENSILASVSLGLALLTKGTALIYCLALGISLSFFILIANRYNQRQFLKAIAVLSMVVIIAIMLNAGHFWRNYHLYGHPLSTERDAYRNKEYSAATLASNILRNGALHIGTPSSRINGYETRAMQLILRSQLNNPNTTLSATHFSIPNSLFSRHEDETGNLIHVLIVVLGFILSPITWYRSKHRRTIWYTLGVLLSLVLYCFILQWQPWASRLHTPLFALASPLLALIITADIGIFRKRFSYVVILIMILYSIPFALHNRTRSLISLEWKHIDRMQLYFQNKNYLYADYNSAMNFLRENANGEVGLLIGEDDWEYPFWVFAGLQSKMERTLTFKHVGVSDISKTLNYDISLPIYVIATKSLETWEQASKYTYIFTSKEVSILRKTEPQSF